jgi:hypothetical protein
MVVFLFLVWLLVILSFSGRRLRRRLVLLPAARPPAARRRGAPPRAAVQEGPVHAPRRRPNGMVLLLFALRPGIRID